jgi:hypothetical protein
MTTRLRDQQHDPDEAVALAARLVASAEPAQPSAQQKTRVRRALARTPHRTPSMRLRFAVVLVVGVGVVGGAAAAISRWTHPQATPGPTIRPEVTPSTAPRHRRGSGIRSAPMSQPNTQTVLETVLPSRTDAPARRSEPQLRNRAPKPTSMPAVARGPRTDGVAEASPHAILVVQAVKALRRDGDTVRAVQLLGEYLRLEPEGALTEDALALGIEATAARDPARAAALARRYLARYPAGRFAGLARDALVQMDGGQNP